YPINREDGGHGGGDERLRRDLFVGGTPDPLGHRAGTADGAASIIIGAAANISIREGRAVRISELIKI
ncbi:MAG: gfo/Idh/MocA family oxidoreductase, partial [Firmicutes bacterium]|nr:gfo/Idh/MocA family oxidoreductase [Bacillota bacterium]